MKACWLTILSLFVTSAMADPFFTGNPWSPIPPGCVTRPDLQAVLYGVNEILVLDRDIDLLHTDSLIGNRDGALSDKRVRAHVRITRQLCAEPNRSALFVQFGFPESLQYTNQAHYLRPDFWADTADGTSVGWFTPLAEPSGSIVGRLPDRLGQPVFGDFADGWENLSQVTWTYLLDLAGPLGGYKDYAAQAADAYNQELSLSSEILMWDEPVVGWQVPATSAAAPPTGMPLNGRHSGTWIVEGARDQGVALSFSNRIPVNPDDGWQPEWAPVFLFLTWFTFDAEGRMLWLTGSGEFPQGAASVEAELVEVRGGSFLGAARAQRSPAGRVTLSARSCAELTLDFDLSALGLGTGTRRLERLHELEIAGYNCRDHEARRQAAHDAARDASD
jgi:hypothetical protein